MNEYYPPPRQRFDQPPVVIIRQDEDARRNDAIYPDELVEQRPVLQPTGSKRGRLVVWLFLGIAAWLGISHLADIKAFFSTIDDIGSSNPESQIKGLVSFGVICVAMLAALKIVLNAQDKDKQD